MPNDSAPAANALCRLQCRRDWAISTQRLILTQLALPRRLHRLPTFSLPWLRLGVQWRRRPSCSSSGSGTKHGSRRLWRNGAPSSKQMLRIPRFHQVDGKRTTRRHIWSRCVGAEDARGSPWLHAEIASPSLRKQVLQQCGTSSSVQQAMGQISELVPQLLTPSSPPEALEQGTLIAACAAVVASSAQQQAMLQAVVAAGPPLEAALSATTKGRSVENTLLSCIAAFFRSLPDRLAGRAAGLAAGLLPAAAAVLVRAASAAKREWGAIPTSPVPSASSETETALAKREASAHAQAGTSAAGCVIDAVALLHGALGGEVESSAKADMYQAAIMGVHTSVAPQGVAQVQLDAVAAQLAAALPDLHAVLAVPAVWRTPATGHTALSAWKAALAGMAALCLHQHRCSGSDVPMTPAIVLAAANTALPEVQVGDEVAVKEVTVPLLDAVCASLVGMLFHVRHGSANPSSLVGVVALQARLTRLQAAVATALETGGTDAPRTYKNALSLVSGSILRVRCLAHVLECAGLGLALASATQADDSLADDLTAASVADIARACAKFWTDVYLTSKRPEALSAVAGAALALAEVGGAAACTPHWPTITAAALEPAMQRVLSGLQHVHKYTKRTRHAILATAGHVLSATALWGGAAPALPAVSRLLLHHCQTLPSAAVLSQAQPQLAADVAAADLLAAGLLPDEDDEGVTPDDGACEDSSVQCLQALEQVLACALRSDAHAVALAVQVHAACIVAEGAAALAQALDPAAWGEGDDDALATAEEALPLVQAAWAVYIAGPERFAAVAEELAGVCEAASAAAGRQGKAAVLDSTLLQLHSLLSAVQEAVPVAADALQAMDTRRG